MHIQKNVQKQSMQFNECSQANTSAKPLGSRGETRPAPGAHRPARLRCAFPRGQAL